MSYKVPFIKPSFPDSKDIAKDYESIVKANWFTNYGPFEQRFRREIQTYIKKPVSVCTVANATLGLEISMDALFTKTSQRKRVLMPSFTFAAGAGVLVNKGFDPVFIDIDASWQPDIEQAKMYLKNHNDKVSGILLCNIFGVGNRGVEEWEELASKYGQKLIIDSAAGFGSEYSKNEYLGARGDCEIFSLHATKPFGIGEGGLIVSRNKGLIEVCRSITNFGFNAERKVVVAGTNAKLQEISCAIGLRQIRSLKRNITNRQNSLRHYKKRLLPYGFIFQPNDELSTVPFVSLLSLSQSTTEAVTRSLEKMSIECKHYYDPLHLQPAFQQYVSEDVSLETTEFMVGRILSLPLHQNMSKKLIDQIADCIINTR